MATITTAQNARKKAKALLEDAVDMFHLQSGPAPRSAHQATVAQALLALADTLDKEEATSDE